MSVINVTIFPRGSEVDDSVPVSVTLCPSARGIWVCHKPRWILVSRRLENFFVSANAKTKPEIEITFNYCKLGL